MKWVIFGVTLFALLVILLFILTLPSTGGTGGGTITGNGTAGYLAIWTNETNLDSINASDYNVTMNFYNNFDQSLNTTDDVTFNTVTANYFYGLLDWSNITNINITTYETDPLWTANETTVARIGTCADGEAVQNTTTTGVECIPVLSGNPFDQWLNTTNDVLFNNLNLSVGGNITWGGANNITDNSTCVIITGATSTLRVC